MDIKFIQSAPESGTRRAALLVKLSGAEEQDACLEVFSPMLADLLPTFWGLPDEALFLALSMLMEPRLPEADRRGNGSGMDQGEKIGFGGGRRD